MTYDTPDGERRLSSSTRKLPRLVADQVDAGDMDSHAVGRDDAHGLAVKVLAGRDEPARDDPVVQDLLVAVDVVEVQLEGLDPLGDAALQPGPLRGRDHPRHQVQRKRPFLTRQRKRDALVDERAAQRIGPGLEFRSVRRREFGVDALVRPADIALSIEHLVESHRVGVRRVVSAEDALRTCLRPRTAARDSCLVSSSWFGRLTSQMLPQIDVVAGHGFPFWEKT